MTTLLLLGVPAIARGGSTRALDCERRTQLLAYLATKRGWVGRAEIAALLWPDQDAKLAYTNLRKALHRLQSLPGAEGIEAQGNALRCELPTDVQAFEAALRDDRVADALALWRGDLLVGFDDEANDAWTGWLGFERDRLRTAWRTAAQRRLSADIDPGEAVEIAARLLEADPLDEDALRHQMQWLARAGQPARARQAYQAYASRLQADLGLAPAADLAALVDTPGTPSPGGKRQATRAPVTGDEGFIGRAVELRRIASLLSQGDCRLLSVTGPGGVGKTRLAQRVTRELAAHFEDGATFVALDDLTTGSEISGRLAQALGVDLKGRGDPLDRVVEALREKHALLVLDNFEHVVAGSPILERMLAGCPQLKVVVTSRVRLHLAQEWLLPIEGLPCPDLEDVDHIAAFDAARLFVRAAQRVNPEFSADAEAASIVEICRQVEGLPLALELSAAWTRVLSCEAIASELRQGTELLHAVDAAQPPRHASFEVVFDQSWRLLTGVEREVLAKLSVFSGSFTPEAARAVTGARLPVLGALVDKSLLHKDGTRLRLHPLVQQLSGRQLGTGDDRARAQAAHAAYFHNLLHQLGPNMVVAGGQSLRTIDAEFENCRQAWRFAIANDHLDAIRRSVPALISYFEDRARFVEGLELLRAALESRVCDGREDTKALLQSGAALLELRLGRYADADADAVRALGARGGAVDPDTAFRAFAVRAGCAMNTGRLDDAKSLYGEALALAREAGSMADAAATLENLALVEKRLGKYDDALRRSVEALGQHRRNGDHARIALCLSNLGSFYMFLDRNDEAASCLNEALALSERHGLVSTRGFVLANLTELALKTRNLGLAQAHAERALEVAESSGMRALAGWLRVQLARLAAWNRDLGKAHALLSSGAEIALALDGPAIKAAAVLALADLLDALGKRPAAVDVLAFGKDQLALSVPDRDELRAAWVSRGGQGRISPPWPGLTLDALIFRLVAEGGVSHAPLIAELSGSP